MSRYTGSAEDVLRIRQAEDTYNTDFLRRFYAARREDILHSGDPVRIRLLQAHDARERNRP